MMVMVCDYFLVNVDVWVGFGCVLELNDDFESVCVCFYEVFEFDLDY